MAVTRVQEAYPEDFADAGIDGPRHLGWISFAGQAPAELHKVLGELPIDVEVRTGLGWSSEALVAVANERHYQLMGEPESAEYVVTEVDTATGTISHTVQPPPGVDGETLERELEAAAAQQTLGARDPAESAAVQAVSDEAIARAAERARVVVTVVDHIAHDDETVYGGGAITGCTAGFSVRSGTYANGLITASHCSDGARYEGRSIMKIRGAHAGASGDVQWHSTSETASARFYATGTRLQTITATANPVPGQQLCKFGQTTRQTCGEVYKVNMCSGNYCGLTMMHRHISDNGDSGGPWFSGSVGYGVHQGSLRCGFYVRSMFTPVRAGAAALGVTVKTG